MRRSPPAQALERLLGPAGPQLGCDECFSELDRHVEVELGGGAADLAVPGMAAHLVGCPACLEDYESLRALVGDERRREPLRRRSTLHLGTENRAPSRSCATGDGARMTAAPKPVSARPRSAQVVSAGRSGRTGRSPA